MCGDGRCSLQHWTDCRVVADIMRTVAVTFVTGNMPALFGLETPARYLWQHAVGLEITISAVNAARHGVDPREAAKHRLNAIKRKVRGTRWNLEFAPRLPN